LTFGSENNTFKCRWKMTSISWEPSLDAIWGLGSIFLGRNRIYWMIFNFFVNRTFRISVVSFLRSTIAIVWIWAVWGHFENSDSTGHDQPSQKQDI
jgi:hypothetical protein